MATKKPNKLIQVNFTGVEAGGGGRLLPEGQYQFELTDIEQKEGEESGKAYLQFELAVADGDFKGTKAWDNMSLQPQSLWKLRGFLEAAGFPTEDGAMALDPDELIGLIVNGDVFHEEYKGKTKHRIGGYSAAEDTATEKEEAPPVTTKKKKAAPPVEEESSDWALKQKVAFMDGKKRMTGVITGIDGDAITVKVGSDEYEMGADDLEAA